MPKRTTKQAQPSDSPTKLPKKRRKTTTSKNGSIRTFVPPENWKEVGAGAVSDEVSEDDRHFEVLIGLMLSAQTKDAVTHGARNRLRDAGILTVDGMIGASVDEIDKLIYPVGMHTTKSKRIHGAAKLLKEKHGGKVPRDMQALLVFSFTQKVDFCQAIPGVGPKMAHLTMLVAFGVCEGISVDTHVHRVSNRLKWAKSKAPLQTEFDLESWMPRDMWSEANHTLVGFGQLMCRPVGPRCDECPVAHLCPSAHEGK